MTKFVMSRFHSLHLISFQFNGIVIMFVAIAGAMSFTYLAVTGIWNSGVLGAAAAMIFEAFEAAT